MLIDDALEDLPLLNREKQTGPLASLAGAMVKWLRPNSFNDLKINRILNWEQREGTASAGAACDDQDDPLRGILD